MSTTSDRRDTTTKSREWGRPPALLFAATLVLAGAAIALAEIDRIIGRSMVAGQNATLRNVSGIKAFGERDAWGQWAQSDVYEIIANLIQWHTFFDLIFVAAYAYLLYRIIAVGTQRPSGTNPQRNTIALGALCGLVVAEVIEAAALFVTAWLLEGGGSPWGWPVAAIATAKWSTVAVLVVSLLRDYVFRNTSWNAVVRAGHAIWVQRLSVLLVVILTIFTLLPMPGALDQVPDAVRQWIDSPLPGVIAVIGYALLAYGALRLSRRRTSLVYDLWVKRPGPAEGSPSTPPADRGQQSPDEAAKLRPSGFMRTGSITIWFVGPVVVAVTAGVLHLTNHAALVDPAPAALFIVFPSTLGLCSLALRGWSNAASVPTTGQGSDPDKSTAWTPTTGQAKTMAIGGLAILSAITFAIAHNDTNIALFIAIPVVAVLCSSIAGVCLRDNNLWKYEPKATVYDEAVQRVRDVDTVGFFAAVTIFAMAGLILIRAFTAPLVLTINVEHHSLFDYNVFTVVPAVFIGWCLLVGAGAVASIPKIGTIEFVAELRATESKDARSDSLLGFGLLGASILALAALTLAPIAVSGALGVVGTLLLALGAWTVLGGLFIVFLQRRQPLEVFRLFHMEANPVLTLVVVLLVSVSLAGGDPDLHALRKQSASELPNRQHLDEAFATWLEESSDCNRPSGDPDSPYSIRPLVMVAASGGGIRAAVWTSQAMSRIAEMNTCGRQAVFMSSGVSGGSVGLTLSGLIDDSDQLRTASVDLAKPDALAAAIGGTAVGDIAANATGIRLQLEDGVQWRDRAGLMEVAWQESIPQLEQPYHVTPGRDATDAQREAGELEERSTVGELILNSTAAGPNCRVLVSQIDLTDLAGVGQSCRDSSAELASTWDMQSLLDECFPSMDWATAAMLSARFPYVTPTGRILPNTDLECTNLAESLQFIDGGYAEGSGLGTLADLAPALATLVREHNSRVIAEPAGDAAASAPLVVPVVVYLDDEPPADRETGEITSSPEVLAPKVGLGAEAELASVDAWAQRITLAYSDVCPTKIGEGRYEFSTNSDEVPSCTDLLFAPAKELTAERFLREGSSTVDDHSKRDIMQSVNGSVITVSPPLGPSVEVPLGWTLSDASIDNLSSVLGNDKEATCADTPRSDGMVVLTVMLCEAPAAR